MNLIRFENSRQAKSYIEHRVEDSLGFQNGKICNEIIALASFKSFREFDEE